MLTEDQQTVLRDLVDDDYSLPSIMALFEEGETVSDENWARAKRALIQLLDEGWVEAFMYFPPFGLSDREQIDPVAAKRMVKTRKQWQLRYSHAHLAELRIGLTNDGRERFYEFWRQQE